MQIDSTNRPANHLNRPWLLWPTVSERFQHALLPTAGQKVTLIWFNLLKESGLGCISVVKDSLTTDVPSLLTRPKSKELPPSPQNNVKNVFLYDLPPSFPPAFRKVGNYLKGLGL